MKDNNEKNEKNERERWGDEVRVLWFNIFLIDQRLSDIFNNRNKFYWLNGKKWSYMFKRSPNIRIRI